MYTKTIGGVFPLIYGCTDGSLSIYLCMVLTDPWVVGLHRASRLKGFLLMLNTYIRADVRVCVVLAICSCMGGYLCAIIGYNVLCMSYTDSVSRPIRDILMDWAYHDPCIPKLYCVISACLLPAILCTVRIHKPVLFIDQVSQNSDLCTRLSSVCFSSGTVHWS